MWWNRKGERTLPGTVFYRKRARTRFFISVYRRLHLTLHLNNPLASALKNSSFSLLAILYNIVQNAVTVFSSVFFIFSLLGPWIGNGRMGNNGKLCRSERWNARKRRGLENNRLYVDKCSNSVLQWAVLPLPMNTSWRQPPPSDQYTILKGVDASLKLFEV